MHKDSLQYCRFTTTVPLVQHPWGNYKTNPHHARSRSQPVVAYYNDRTKTRTTDVPTHRCLSSSLDSCTRHSPSDFYRVWSSLQKNISRSRSHFRFVHSGSRFCIIITGRGGARIVTRWISDSHYIKPCALFGLWFGGITLYPHLLIVSCLDEYVSLQWPGEQIYRKSTVLSGCSNVVECCQCE